MAAHPELHAVAVNLEVRSLQIILWPQSKTHDRRVSLLQHLRQHRIIPVGGDQSVGGNEPQQQLKRLLEVVQRTEDVGVVELQIVENELLRLVVEELGTFVEEGGVVLVAFGDEAVALAFVATRPQILGNASDQKTRIASCFTEHPCEQSRRRGLAVSACNDKGGVALNEMFLEQCCHRDIAQPLCKRGLHFRVAPRKRIADHHKIRSRIKIHRRVTLVHRESVFSEQSAHRRIDVRVRAGDTVSAFLQQHGQRSHRCSADAREMKVGWVQRC